jgi:hypothetical protein
MGVIPRHWDVRQVRLISTDLQTLISTVLRTRLKYDCPVVDQHCSFLFAASAFFKNIQGCEATGHVLDGLDVKDPAPQSG